MSAGKKGTGTFIRQRATGAVNIVMAVFLIWLVLSLGGADRAQMVGTFSNPVVFILALALFVSVTIHMRIGMGEVIEDYIHDPRIFRLTMFLNTLFAVAVGAVGAISVLVLAFGG